MERVVASESLAAPSWLQKDMQADCTRSFCRFNKHVSYLIGREKVDARLLGQCRYHHRYNMNIVLAKFGGICNFRPNVKNPEKKH